MRKKIKVRLKDGTIIERVPMVLKLGNFVNIYIRYNNKEFWVGDGDEYLRGMPECFEIGKEKKV